MPVISFGFDGELHFCFFFFYGSVFDFVIRKLNLGLDRCVPLGVLGLMCARERETVASLVSGIVKSWIVNLSRSVKSASELGSIC